MLERHATSERENAELVAFSATFSGPIPPPALLEGYNDAVPGLGDRIGAQWEAEAVHRRKALDFIAETDRLALIGYHAGERRGSRNALVLGIGVLVVIVVAMLLDYPAIGLTGTVAAIGTMMWAMRRDASGPGEPRLTAESIERGVEGGDA